MPTVLRSGPYRFYFYSSNGVEPVHVHVAREGRVAKFWVEPVRLAESGGFRAAELLEIQKIVENNRTLLVRSWHEFFGG